LHDLLIGINSALPAPL